jgi:hypothetical protein
MVFHLPKLIINWCALFVLVGLDGGLNQSKINTASFVY